MLDKIYELPWENVGISAVILLSFFLFRKIFAKYIIKLFQVLTSKTKNDLDDKLLKSFEKPFQGFITVLGFYLALMYLDLPLKADLIITKAFRVSVIFFIAKGLYNITGTSSALFESVSEKFNMKLDKILFPFLSKCTRFIVVLLTLSIIAQELGYNVSGLITGVGIGGLAFALAAKDSLGNLFAGVNIVIEKPFSIGDWIKTPNVEGTVEDINFRSTKVRTFDQALVTVPNSVLVNSAITNWSKMGKRRITFKLGVTYSTSRVKIETVVKRIKKLLTEHPEINQETIFVNFDSFNNSSLDIFLYFFTNTTNWGDWLAVKEEINIEIMKILEEEGVSIAYPSQSIYFENEIKTKTNNEG